MAIETIRNSDYFHYSERIETVGKISKAERKKLADLYFPKHITSNFKIMESAERDNVIYYAIKNIKDNNIIAAVVPTAVTSYKETKDFIYDIIFEDEGPIYYYKCPKKILKLLTPTDDTYALEWRKICIEKNHYHIN